MTNLFEKSGKNHSKPLCLIGMMGVGKTTIGRSLAAHFSCDFFDSDQEIIRTTGQSISEIFAQHGEEKFRTYEYETFQKLSGHDFCVIASGGGAVTHPQTAELLFQHTLPIWLQASPATLLTRIGNVSTRPLLKDADNPAAVLKKKLAEREPLYQQAPLHIQTDNKSVTEIVADISTELDQYLLK